MKNQNIGQKNRSKYPGLASKYPECVIIEKMSVSYSISKRTKGIGATAIVIQFPLKLAAAITAHKFQGQTVEYPITVAMDLNSVFEDAQAYVMLSRVQCLDQVFIAGKFEAEKIRPSNHALTENVRLVKESWNRNPDIWRTESNSTIKIAMLNCDRLQPHIADIQSDSKLLMADIIHLAETWLQPSTQCTDISIEGYKTFLINIGDGKGIATFIKKSSIIHVQDIAEPLLQITVFKTTLLDIISIYRSAMGSDQRLLEHLKEIILTNRATIITGDFNICFKSVGKHRLIQGLTNMGFIQLVRGATHIRGGLIDHAYWRNCGHLYKEPEVQQFSPYYSDHDALLISIQVRAIRRLNYIASISFLQETCK